MSHSTAAINRPLMRATHHAHAATLDQRLHRRPRPPARTCAACGCLLRATNHDRHCAPCDTRLEATPPPPPTAHATRGLPPAAERSDVHAALARIHAMRTAGQHPSRARYDRTRGTHLSSTRLRILLAREWSAVVALALTTEETT